jgi:hypothetical protein
MKRSTTILALTLGLSAFTALAQSQGDQAKQLTERPERRDAKANRDDRRDDEERPQREQRRDQARLREMEQDDRGVPARRYAPGRPGLGPRQGFGPGRQFRGPEGQGEELARPPFMSRQGRMAENFCPYCGRPTEMNPAQGWGRPGGQGFAPRQGFGRMQRNFGPQARGPAFGPPPWAGRGNPEGDVRPVPRERRPDAPMPDREMGPSRRGPGAPEGDGKRFEDRDQDRPREQAAPRERERRPAEPDER